MTGAMNGKLYIAGGMDEDTDNDRLFTTDMMCWDLNAAKPVWTKAASLPADLAGGHLVTQNGKMYYIMGFTGLMEENRSVYEVLDLGFGKCRMCVCGPESARDPAAITTSPSSAISPETMPQVSISCRPVLPSAPVSRL